jgi:predicted Zn-dependent protease
MPAQTWMQRCRWILQFPGSPRWPDKPGMPWEIRKQPHWPSRPLCARTPEDPIANLDLGAIRLKERNFKSARPLLELALQLQPRLPLARFEMAKLDETTGKYAESAAILEDLVKAEPNYLDAHWELATVYTGLNRTEEGSRERMIAQLLRTRRQKEEPGTK